MALLHLLLGVFGVEVLVNCGGGMVTGEEERKSRQVVAGGIGDVDKLGSHVSITVGTDKDIDDEVMDGLKSIFDHGGHEGYLDLELLCKLDSL